MPSLDLPASVHVLQRGWLSSNSVVLFDDERSATLIDSGYDSHAAQTVELVRHAVAGRQLARIVNTHLHSDHCGGNAALIHAFGARVVIPPGHADAVARWDERVLTFAATGQRCERFTFDSVLQPGDTLCAGALDWEILAAPGHDPQSVALWSEQERLLISADALWENGFGVIFPELEGESGFAEQATLLDQFERLDPAVVIPGHGAPFGNVPAAIERARQRLAALSASPERNARHAAKVLLKFLLLDWRETAFDALLAHLAQASYFTLINERYFRQPFAPFVRAIADELVASGVAAWRGDVLVNCD